MDEKTTTVHITKALSSSMIMDLIDEYPNLEVITCSPSVYDRTSSKYIDALSQLDIEVKKSYNWGAKSKTNGEEFEVLSLSQEGFKPKEIAQKLDISLNRVYYLLRKADADFDYRKRKYDHDKIRQMRENGMSVKEISEELDIPIRNIYNILNKK